MIQQELMIQSRRERLSAISAISAVSMTGELYLAVQDHSYKGPDVIRFSERLLEEVPGKLLLNWDGAPIHRSPRSTRLLYSTMP